MGASWKVIVFVVTPIVLSVLPLAVYYQYGFHITCCCVQPCNMTSTNSTEFSSTRHPYYEMSLCGYVLLVMTVFWVTECVPLAATALLPAVAFPLFGIVQSSDISPAYWSDINMLFFGGVLLAIAVERWNLHKRIALKMLIVLGTKPRWLLLGFMLPTWCLSMWFSNAATTAMMLPIVEAMLSQLQSKRSKKDDVFSPLKPAPNAAYNPENVDKDFQLNLMGEDLPEYTENSASMRESTRIENLGTVLSLAVAYSASIGGAATLNGGGANLVMAHVVTQLAEEHGSEGVSYGQWLSFGFPTSTLVITCAYLWLGLYGLGPREMFRCEKSEHEDISSAVLRNAYTELGKFSFAEGAVLVHCIVTALLWITRSPGFIDGWGTYLPFARDSTVAVLVAFFLFFCPARCSNWCKKGSCSTRPLLTWEEAQNRIPFGVFVILGGGYALALGCKVSGLSMWLGQQLSILGLLPPVALILVLNVATSLLTEITSNSAISSIVMPVFATMAFELGYSPRFLLFPTAVCGAFAFMLPAATPPNTIVYSHGRVRVAQMIKIGGVLNFLAVLCVTFTTHTIGQAVFKFQAIKLTERPNLTANLSQVIESDSLCHRFTTICDSLQTNQST